MDAKSCRRGVLATLGQELGLPGFQARPSLYNALWFYIYVIGMLLAATVLIHSFQVDAYGISPNANKPPTWDFTNLWYGGRLVAEGRMAVLFDPDTYRQGLRDMFAPYIDDSEWSYPPSILLIGVPLALLPLYPAYAVWTLGTLGMLAIVLRKAGLPALACALVLISPASLINITFGQNGAFTAALLIGGLLYADKKPMLAGICFGLLTMKPHLGLLVPICLVAAGLWRAIVWSTLVAIAVACAPSIFFGSGLWTGFFDVTQPLMKAILEAPYSGTYQANSTTFFTAARAAGLSVQGAYLVQGIATLAAAAMAWKLWRAPQGDPLLRAGATAMLTLVATPYGYTYDMVMMAVAVMAILCRAQWRQDILLGLAWIWPGVNNVTAKFFAPIASSDPAREEEREQPCSIVNSS